MKSYVTTEHVHLDLRTSAGSFEGDIKPGTHTPSDDVPQFVFDHLTGIGLAQASKAAKGPKAPETVEA